jgi:hypothetical protein
MTATNARQDLLPFHPLARNFPLMNGSEFNELVADVKANNGLHEPITLYQGKILDGRNRYRACLNAKVEPRFEEFEGNNAAALAFVISKNIHRRHLKAKEKRDAIAALLKAAPEKSDRQIGKMAKVDGKTVAAVRAEQEGREEFPHVETRTDTKGRKQPAKKKVRADGKARKQPARKPTKRQMEQQEWDRRVRKEMDQVVAILIERLGRDGFVLVAAPVCGGVGFAFKTAIDRQIKGTPDEELVGACCFPEDFIAKFGTGLGSEGNGADAEASADKRREQFAALEAEGDPEPIPECPRRDRVQP